MLAARSQLFTRYISVLMTSAALSLGSQWAQASDEPHHGHSHSISILPFQDGQTVLTNERVVREVAPLPNVAMPSVGASGHGDKKQRPR